MGPHAETPSIRTNLLKSRPTNDQKQNKATSSRHQKVSDTWYEEVPMQSNCCLYSPRNRSQDVRRGSWTRMGENNRQREMPRLIIGEQARTHITVQRYDIIRDVRDTECCNFRKEVSLEFHRQPRLSPTKNSLEKCRSKGFRNTPLTFSWQSNSSHAFLCKCTYV